MSKGYLVLGDTQMLGNTYSRHKYKKVLSPMFRVGDIVSYEDILQRFREVTLRSDNTIRVMGIEDKTLYRLTYEPSPTNCRVFEVHITKYLGDEKKAGNLTGSFDMLYMILATVSLDELVKFMDHPCAKANLNGIGSLIKCRLQGFI